MNITDSTATYDAWLHRQLPGEVVEADLHKKHARMRSNRFVFLRATYWRWAEVMPALVPKLAAAPAVLAVGDVHVENFGTWRDADGRLVWGLNDFDEAFGMPYGFDLLRLAVSGWLAMRELGDPPPATLASICERVLEGYRAGLAKPRPYVLDRDHTRLRAKFVATEEDRAAFWRKMEKNAAAAHDPVPARFRAALDRALPEGATDVSYWPRTAGVGSLGRPRWVASAEWEGGPVVREAKGIVTSGWAYARGLERPALRIADIVAGRHRAPDPWYRVDTEDDRVLVRRLSPNNHKIEMDVMGRWIFEHDLLCAMGREVANVHLSAVADDGVAAAIGADLDRRDARWWTEAATRAVASIETDFADWCRQPPAARRP
jgi:uncharacterized protein (DUF2252 family)